MQCLVAQCRTPPQTGNQKSPADAATRCDMCIKRLKNLFNSRGQKHVFLALLGSLVLALSLRYGGTKASCLPASWFGRLAIWLAALFKVILICLRRRAIYEQTLTLSGWLKAYSILCSTLVTLTYFVVFFFFCLLLQQQRLVSSCLGLCQLLLHNLCLANQVTHM